MAGQWIIQKAERSNQAASILAFLLKEFSRLVGSDVMYREDCIVYNDPNADVPMLIINALPVRIRLVQKGFEYWAQTIYQLSHEMCHFAFRQCKEKKEFTLRWFEEIVCEAMSLYALEYSSRNWQCCQLSKINPSFAQSNESYLNGELAKGFSDEFKKCDSVAKLIEYEKGDMPDGQRETHGAERNVIYRAISANPLELRSVLDYTKHISANGVVIDFDKWIQDKPCNLLNCLKQIQPVK